MVHSLNRVKFKTRVKQIMDNNDISMYKLAKMLDVPYPRLYKKFQKDRFTEEDMNNIADKLGYKLILRLEKIE